MLSLVGGTSLSQQGLGSPSPRWAAQNSHMDFSHSRTCQIQTTDSLVCFPTGLGAPQPRDLGLIYACVISLLFRAWHMVGGWRNSSVNE